MKRISPTGLTGDDLLRHFEIALATRDRMVSAVDDGKDILLDLRDAEWFTPAFLVPISVVYNQLNRDGSTIEVKMPEKSLVRRYLEQIEFPSGTDAPTTNFENNLPLCSMNTDREADVVEVVGKKIRELIKQQLRDDVSDSGIMWINYPMIEVIDNVDYHSDCDYGALLVQNYPNKPFLDVCIADDGVSIPGNFDQYGIDFNSDAEAIRGAMQDGTSTRQDTGFERGFGLRTTVEMICDGLTCEAFVSSRNATVARDQGQGLSTEGIDQYWEGTVFTARLNRPNENFDYKDYIYPE